MAIAYQSWVSETGTLTGTDPTYTLPNTATTGSGNQYLRTVGAAFTVATDIVLTISNSSGAETSVWSFTPGTGGAAGTITRSQLIESTTGSAINWSGATVTLECANPAPVQTSAGATSAGLLAALGSGGQFDSSLVSAHPLAGFIPSGTQTLVSPRNTSSASGNNFQVTANTWYRENVLWTFSQTPQYIGFWAQGGGTAGNCRLLIHSPDASGNAGTLIYDSGTFATPTSFTKTFYPPTALPANSLPPGVYIFSHCFDSAFEINVSSDMVQAGAWTGLVYQIPTQKFTYAGAIGTIPPATQTGWSGVNAAGTAGYRTSYFGKF